MDPELLLTYRESAHESRGFRVLAPAYPGFEVEVEALNADPTPIEELTVPAVMEHLHTESPESVSPLSTSVFLTTKVVDASGAAAVGIAPSEKTAAKTATITATVATLSNIVRVALTGTSRITLNVPLGTTIDDVAGCIAAPPSTPARVTL